MIQKKKILVTVGTTEFEALVNYTDSQEFLDLVREVHEEQKTQEKLPFQRGIYIPSRVEFIRLSDRISQIYNESDFIICHGGAGTLLQNLRNGKKIMAIANDTLAGNHQIELINKLAKQNYLLGFKNVEEMKKNPEKVKQFLSDKMKFKPYEKVTKNILNDIIFNEK